MWEMRFETGKLSVLVYDMKNAFFSFVLWEIAQERALVPLFIAYG